MYLVKLQTGLTFTSKDICSLCTFYKEKERNHSIRLVTSSIASSIFCLCLSGRVLPLLLPPSLTPWKDGGQMGGTGFGGSALCSVCPCLPERGLSPTHSPTPCFAVKGFEEITKKTNHPLHYWGLSCLVPAVTRFCPDVQLSSFLWLSVISICNLWETKQETCMETCVGAIPDHATQSWTTVGELLPKLTVWYRCGYRGIDVDGACKDSMTKGNIPAFV